MTIINKTSTWTEVYLEELLIVRVTIEEDCLSIDTIVQNKYQETQYRDKNVNIELVMTQAMDYLEGIIDEYKGLSQVA